MNKLLQYILDYAEVWALFIPMGVLLFNRQQPKFMKPVIIYLWLALLLDVCIDTIMTYNDMNLGPLISNNYLYNLHSMMRFICFSYFFLLLDLSFYQKILRVLPFISVLFVVINFGFVKGENLFDFGKLSGNLLTAEAYLLLIGCIIYYLARLKEEVPVMSGGKGFWVITGISFYVVINFFVFLFYDAAFQLYKQTKDQLVNYMWNFHNIAYIILCIFLAKAFYVQNSVRYRHA